MSDSDPRSLHEELEVRVIALLTGELPESEAEELEQILMVNPELSDFRDRMAVLIGDVHEARDEVAPPVEAQDMRLTDEQRREIFGDVYPLAIDRADDLVTETRTNWKYRIVQIAAVFAVLFIVGAIMIPSVGKVQQQASRDFYENAEFEAPPALEEAKPAAEQMSKRYLALKTEIPPELIEGTPAPIRLGKSASSEEFRFSRGVERRDDSADLKEDIIVLTESEPELERMVALNDPEPASGEMMFGLQMESDEFAAKKQSAPHYGFPSGSGAADFDSESVAGSVVSSVSAQDASHPVDFYVAMGVGERNASPVASTAPQAAPPPSPVIPDRLEDLSLVAAVDSGQKTFSNEMSAYSAFVSDDLPVVEAKNRIRRTNEEASSEFVASGIVDANQELSKWGSDSEAMLAEVEQHWGRPKVFDGRVAYGALAMADSVTVNKLDSIVIPELKFKEMELSRAIETISELSVEYDPGRVGTQIVSLLENQNDTKISLHLKGASLRKILSEISNLSGVDLISTNDFVAFRDSDSEWVDLIDRDERLRQMVIPQLKFSEMPLSEVVGILNRVSVEYDPDRVGIPVTVKAASGEDPIVDIELRNLALDHVIQLIADKVGFEFVALDDGIRFQPEGSSSAEVYAQNRAQNSKHTPKPEKQTSEAPVSTFSLNVSDVSFKLAQAALNTQRIPDASLIRSEEFVNSFSYGDPVPAENEAVSLNWEIAQHPYQHNRQIVRFSLQTQAQGRAADQPLNLNLLVDNSGSMQRPDRRAILERSLESLQENLTDQDQLNIILFARQPKLIANATTVATQKAAINDALNYQPEGGTNLEEGLAVAYETAQANYDPRASNRVILLTDGAANLGDVNAEALAEKVVEQRKQGVALDAYGIGWEDYNDALLEEITRNGDGRYAFLNSVETAADDFAEKLAGSLRVAAADVKVQIIWNPERVQAYRQIGYDLHQLREQDFRDNSVDAAEIGEAESGTALYVIKMNEDSDVTGGLGKLQVRYRVPATGEYVEHAWPLEMPRQIPELEKAPASLRLAAASALFAERLSNNPYASNYDFEDLEKLTSDLPDVFPKQPRVVELQNMIQSANLLFTKVE